LGRMERGDRRRNSIGGISPISFEVESTGFSPQPPKASTPSHRREISEGGGLRSRLSLDSTWSELQPLEENGFSPGGGAPSSSGTPTSNFSHFAKTSPLEGLVLRYPLAEKSVVGRRESLDLGSPDFQARLSRRESLDVVTPPDLPPGRQAVKRTRSSVSIQVPPELLAQFTPPSSAYPSPIMVSAL
jgi:hypothetical protein